ncbi:MAG: hypothetical protein K5945_05085 [Bacteroidaceae bacterium]|nr:hypothetical protein [Bacteroidaceae bacterium]
MHYYRVGGHPLSITFAGDEDIDRMLPSFARFALTATPDEPLLLEVVVDDNWPWDDPSHEIGQFDSTGNNYGVYLRPDGGYQYEISDVTGVLCSRVTTNADFSRIVVSLVGQTETQRNFGLNNALMLGYAFAAADRQTLLMHASVIRHAGRGYLMTAPSGTGKSTHTRLWYDNIPDCDLMNDDNPVVRIFPDGRVVVYGSPWSGKTPCYRNVEAPVGAIVRIRQRPENSIRQLRPSEAFGMLLPQMSSMKWDARVYRGVCDSITNLVRLCRIYELGCLPDADAARLCHDTVAS